MNETEGLLSILEPQISTDYDGCLWRTELDNVYAAGGFDLIFQDLCSAYPERELYKMSTDWHRHRDVTILKCKGVRGDLVLRVRYV